MTKQTDKNNREVLSQECDDFIDGMPSKADALVRCAHTKEGQGEIKKARKLSAKAIKKIHASMQSIQDYEKRTAR